MLSDCLTCHKLTYEILKLCFHFRLCTCGLSNFLKLSFNLRIFISKSPPVAGQFNCWCFWGEMRLDCTCTDALVTELMQPWKCWRNSINFNFFLNFNHTNKNYLRRKLQNWSTSPDWLKSRVLTTRWGNRGCKCLFSTSLIVNYHSVNRGIWDNLFILLKDFC